MSLATSTISLVSKAITEQSLPAEFIDIVTDYYQPLSSAIAQSAKARKSANAHSTFFVGIQGSQGSGKSTCASFIKLLLESEYNLRVVVASIDDFYLTRAERQQLSQSQHPLFATRGVPGTHDIDMIKLMFDKAKSGDKFSVPSFDKARDDRAPENAWQTVEHPVDVLILEGWCVGIGPQKTQALIDPINRLEADEDSNRDWRNAVNRALSDEYQTLFSRLDLLISLQAPSFDCVLGWRQLQEEKMIEKLQAAGKSIELAQSPDQIKRFISHYQRLTEHALATMPDKADYILQLDVDHRFTALHKK